MFMGDQNKQKVRFYKVVWSRFKESVCNVDQSRSKLLSRKVTHGTEARLEEWYQKHTDHIWFIVFVI